MSSYYSVAGSFIDLAWTPMTVNDVPFGEVVIRRTLSTNSVLTALAGCGRSADTVPAFA